MRDRADDPPNFRHSRHRMKDGCRAAFGNARNNTKQYETKAFSWLIKNDKFFVLPPNDDSDFKELFTIMAVTGAGRPVDEHGFAIGPWTPELLADAIGQIDTNKNGIELRTVQLWFQKNDKGISPENLRWLAQVFGCNDPLATSEWQRELTAALARLAAKRRARRSAKSSDGAKAAPEEIAEVSDRTSKKRGFSLARASEAFFGRGSPLDLPSVVFAGAVGLGFASYFLGIHSVIYARQDGLLKQVGFLWAPNWTLLFMAFIPLFFAVTVEVLTFWKTEARSTLVAASNRAESDAGWMRNVEASAYTYWAVLLICFGFAGVFQWIGTRFIPLTSGGIDRGNYTMDWGSIALSQPDLISIPISILFTGCAYLYMSVCFYLFFVGLIILYTMVHDLWQILNEPEFQLHESSQTEINAVGIRVMRAIFRCTVLGILIAMCMKLQSFYKTTDGSTILNWLATDLSNAFSSEQVLARELSYSMPTHYSSLLITISTLIVFLYGAIRLGFSKWFDMPLEKMIGVVGFLLASYLTIGAFSGFSILLSIGLVLATYSLFDPSLRTPQTTELGEQ